MAIGRVALRREYFREKRDTIYAQGKMEVVMFRYPSGVEALEITNELGRMTVLPYMGQMIWDLMFDGIDLKMKNMFDQPRKAETIIDTYGCFAFHSGLLQNGCPAPEDDHALHGEMPCADMDEAWLEIDQESIKVCGTTEYVKGFGHHYVASPSVTMFESASFIEIKMNVRNLSSAKMPLQYMCHTNYAYVEGAKMEENLPEGAFTLRKTVPAHVKPNEQWLAYNEALLEGRETLASLDRPEMYDPEIVFFADRLDRYAETAEFRMTSPEAEFFTRFKTSELNYATRWLLYNGDQQVGAFVLPATCRPEGYLAAEASGTLIELAAGEERTFTVTTGMKKGDE